MMKKETVQKILEIDEQALSIVNEAKEKAHALVRDAEAAAKKETDRMIDQAKQQAATITAESTEKAQSTRRLILKQAEDRANDVRKTASGNIANAVTYILEHVVPSI